VTQRDWHRELADALDPVTTVRSSGDIDGRLTRIEALLDADLDRLGDAVLGATVARLDARLAELAERVEALLARFDEAAPRLDGSPEGPADVPA
jgi:hypothetical protein